MTVWLNRLGEQRLWAASPEHLARLSVFFYLAALPFPHNAAWKNVAAFFMLLVTGWLVGTKRLKVDWHSPLVLGLLVLLTLVGASSLAGIAPLEGFNELRKHLLPAILLFLLTAFAFREGGWREWLFIYAGSLFLLRIALAVAELTWYGDLYAARTSGNFVKGVALDAGFYLPVYFGLFLSAGQLRWWAGAATAAAFAIIILTQGRAPLLAGLLAIAAMLIALRRWRLLLLLLGVGLFTTIVLGLARPDLRERFLPAFSPHTYIDALDTRAFGRESDGLSGRIPIWLGVIEIARERPLLGYGFGWKKLGRIAVEDGFVERWEQNKQSLLAEAQVNYFSLPTDKVNPHNLYLQIFFEAGLVGLVVYCAVLGLFVRVAWQQTRQGADVGGATAAIVLGFLVDHLVLGLANGLWIGLGPSMAWLGVLEAIRQKRAS
ncbi:O-antigen ligase family protein [Thiobacter aerophilum]|uniref:O-antigen ligase family protein n=1 Tax=Thiobacter aerophilum TaxID=3121275 RepID=A0ABV0ECL7_9BURK